MRLGILKDGFYVGNSCKRYPAGTLVEVRSYQLVTLDYSKDIISFMPSTFKKEWSHIVTFIKPSKLLSLLFPQVLNKETE